MTDTKKSIYSATWDKYVAEAFPRIQSGPRPGRCPTCIPGRC